VGFLRDSNPSLFANAKELTDWRLEFDADSGDDVRPHSPVKTVDTKVLAVHGEDFSDTFTLSNPNKNRISKIHLTVSVLAHQLANSRNVS
jgi:hypothetical protein